MQSACAQTAATETSTQLPYALSGDIIFDPKVQRTINVDVRMVLWTIEKYGKAGHLISEMTLVK